MGQLSPILRDATDNTLLFWCPGCRRAHAIQHGAGAGPRWGWNNDARRPTFTPSVLVTYNGDDADLPGKPAAVCHSYVTNGRIDFLGDSTHHLAGQTVDLPAWPRAEEA